MIKDKWVFGENITGERQYIIHMDHPRFIGEIDDNEGTIEVAEWIDEQPHKLSKGVDAALFYARLMREAGEALIEYDARLEADIEEDEDE